LYDAKFLASANQKDVRRLKVVEIDNLSGFLALKEKWNDVLIRCDNNVFSTWEWLTCWWKHFGKNKRIHILLAEEKNNIIGIAPLMYSIYSMFGLRQGKIEFLGTPNSDYNDFLLAAKSDECIKLFVDQLNTQLDKWSCIDLTDIPQKSKTLSVLSTMTRNLKPVHKCPFTSLPKSSNAYLQSLPRKHRRELNRSIRVLERGHEDGFCGLFRCSIT
jgi:CelD/BcsL family acetyltransferase involved in cellulose biosynthesis